MPPPARLVEATDRGLYCRAGDFFIDPWRPTAGSRAVITHAHSDHAQVGAGEYLTSASGAGVLRLRLGDGPPIATMAFGEERGIGDVRVSLFPAGHILGSAMVRLEHKGEVWVVSGDYKTVGDATCEPMELPPPRCHTFITESTFGLPIYRWPEPGVAAAELNGWWRANAEEGRTSVAFGYSLGKAQRLLAALDPSIGPIFVHGAVGRFLPAYAAAGVRLPRAVGADRDNVRGAKGRAMVIGPPTAHNTAWVHKFGEVSTAFASGWMRIRGTRRRRNIDRGFVLSDHADWPGLLSVIEATGAERVGVTHGYTGPLVRWLREHGREAWEVPTRFEGEDAEADVGGRAGEAGKEGGAREEEPDVELGELDFGGGAGGRGRG